MNIDTDDNSNTKQKSDSASLESNNMTTQAKEISPTNNNIGELESSVEIPPTNISISVDQEDCNQPKRPSAPFYRNPKHKGIVYKPKQVSQSRIFTSEKAIQNSNVEMENNNAQTAKHNKQSQKEQPKKNDVKCKQTENNKQSDKHASKPSHKQQPNTNDNEIATTSDESSGDSSSSEEDSDVAGNQLSKSQVRRQRRARGNKSLQRGMERNRVEARAGRDLRPRNSKGVVIPPEVIDKKINTELKIQKKGKKNAVKEQDQSMVQPRQYHRMQQCYLIWVRNPNNKLLRKHPQLHFLEIRDKKRQKTTAPDVEDKTAVWKELTHFRCDFAIGQNYYRILAGSLVFYGLICCVLSFECSFLVFFDIVVNGAWRLSYLIKYLEWHWNFYYNIEDYFADYMHILNNQVNDMNKKIKLKELANKHKDTIKKELKIYVKYYKHAIAQTDE